MYVYVIKFEDEYGLRNISYSDGFKTEKEARAEAEKHIESVARISGHDVEDFKICIYDESEVNK